MDFDQPPVVRVDRADGTELPAGQWPRTIPAVEQVLSDGLTLAKGVTFLGRRERFGRVDPGPPRQLVQHCKASLDSPGRYLRHMND